METNFHTILKTNSFPTPFIHRCVSDSLHTSVLEYLTSPNNGITFHDSRTCRLAISHALPTEITIPHQQPSHFYNQHALESHSHTKADRKAVTVNVHTWRRPLTNSSLPPPMDCHCHPLRAWQETAGASNLQA